jgi:hypothetical protein
MNRLNQQETALTDETIIDQPAETALLVENKDVLDRIVELGQESRDVQLHEIEAPDGVYGIPAKVPVLVKYGPHPSVLCVADFFEPYRSAPPRRAGAAKVTTLQSFIDLVNRHSDEHSVVFAQTEWPATQLLAVIDYHQTDGSARFGRHRIVYDFPITEEFSAWMQANGKWLEQAAFAEFLEEHAKEVAAPFDTEKTEYEPLFKERFAAPNELITLSRSLEIYVGQKVKRQERLQTGERTILFETSHTNEKGDPVDIPGIFMVSVNAFVASTERPMIRIPARLRYRVSGGEIKWGYQLYRPEFWLRAQVQNDLAEVATATSLPTYEGAPEQ